MRGVARLCLAGVPAAIGVCLVVALALGSAGSAAAGELRFSAAGRADAKLLLVRRGGELELRRAGSGVLLARRPLARTRGVSIEGEDGNVDNTLTVDLAGGPIVVPGGVRYDGGHGGFNTLVLRGGSAAGEKSIPSGPHSGLLEVGATRILYADIAPIMDTTPAISYTFNIATAGPVSIADGPVVAGAQTLTITSTANPAAFEATTIANKQNLTVNTPAGANALTFDVPTAATGLASPLTVNATAGSGNVASIVAVPAGITLDYNGGSGDTVTVGAGAGAGMQAIAGILALSFTASGSVTLNDAGDSTGRTVNVGASQVSGLTPNPIGYANTTQMTIDGGSGSDSFEVSPSATTAYSVAGGGPAPPATPGDELSAELGAASGATLIGTSGPSGARGAWLFANRQPLQFSGIDSLDPTAASIADATVNPGTSGVTPLTFTVSLLAPDPNPVQLDYATADGTATTAAGDYQAASGNLLFAAGQTSQPVTVDVPGISTPGPTKTFVVNLTAVGSVQLARAQATGTILDTAAAPPPLATPAVSALMQSASRWREGTRLATISASRRPPVGTTFTFGLNEAGSLTLSFTRRRAGREVGGTCVAPTARDRRKRSCTRTSAAGVVGGLAGVAGSDRVFFDGLLTGGAKLPSGRYSLALTATNSQHATSSAATIGFTIVK